MTTPPSPDKNDDAFSRKVEIPDGGQLWVAIEEQEGFAPAVIVGGNAQGLRMLAALCTGLASSGVQHGQVALNAGDLLLEGSEADMVIALRPDAEDDASKPAGAAECGPHALPATSVVRHLCNASNSEPALRRTKRPAFACPAG